MINEVKSPFLTASNIFKFDSNTLCSLVRYTFGKLTSGVISLLSMSIPSGVSRISFRGGGGFKIFLEMWGYWHGA